MLVHAIFLTSCTQTQVRRNQQFSGSWSEFVERVGTHVVGPKDGTAVLPILARWDGDIQPRKGIRDQPGVVSSLVTLDLDELTDDELDGVHSRLAAKGVSYLLHSTWSYDPTGAPKARVHIPLAVAVPSDEVPSIRLRVGAWLGVRVDPATIKAHSLFFLPRCPEEYLSDAFSLVNYGRPITIDELPSSEEEVERARPMRTKISEVRPHAEWAQPVKDTALEHLGHVVRRIESHRSIHLREDLKRTCTIIGGYITSGCLDRVPAMRALRAAIDVRASRFKNDDHSAEHRWSQIEEMLSWGYERPLTPRGFNAQGIPTVKGEHRSGIEGTRAVLEAQTPERILTVGEATEEMTSFIREPRGRTPWVGVVEVSTGVGKTHALLELARERAALYEYTVIVTQDHQLLGQMRHDLNQMGVPVHHLHSVIQPTSKTGSPECARIDEPIVKVLLKRGVNIQGSMCSKCTLRPTCPAVKKRKLMEYVLLAPYALINRALKMVEDAKDSIEPPLIVCDEEPPRPEQATITMSDLADMRAASTRGWMLLREDQSRDMTLLLDALEQEQDDIPKEVITDLSDFHGQLHMAGMSLHEDRLYSDDLDAAGLLLHCVQGWSSRKKINNVWYFQLPDRTWDALERDGGFVLSATPTPDIYEGLNVWVEQRSLRVRDHHEDTKRELLYTPYGCRSIAVPEGRVEWTRISKDLELLFERIPMGQRVLIGTYKVVADHLRTTHAHLLQGRHVDVWHYEIMRGRNDWREHDVFASLYDPIPPPLAVVKATSVDWDWSSSKQSAARTLAQFHGRARDPRPRATPAHHIHVGRIPPLDWFSGNTSCTLFRTSTASHDVIGT